MADYKIQGEASLDVSKAEGSLNKLGQSAERTTQTIAQQSQKASKAAEGIGDGINVGAQKFSRAESQISASIKRATTQLELMGKTASQRLEFRINERGLDASKFEPALRKLRELEKAQFQVNKETQRFGSVADQARSQLASFAAAAAGVISVRSFVQAADAVTQLQNQLKLAAGGAVEAQQAYQGLFEIAQRSRVSFVELGSTFASISRASGELGLSQRQLLTLTEAIGNAVTVSGSSAQASNAALVQLSQGLASGVLRGEELNSIMEQTPRLARAIADGLGVPIGKLREMGKEGELTADRVISALQSQSKVLAGEVRESVLTLGQAFTQLKNSATVLVGEVDRVAGVTSFMAAEVQGASEAIDNIARAFRGAENAGRQTAIFADAIAVVFETVAVVGANVAFVITQIGKELGGLAAQATAVASLNFSQAGAIRREMLADAEKARSELDAFESRVLNARRLNRIAEDKTSNLDTRAEDARLGRLAGNVDKVTVAANKASKATKAMGDEFASVREIAREWEKVVEGFTKATASADAETLGLTKSQAQLVEYLGSPAYLQASESMRQVALQAAYGAISAEQNAEATKLQAEAMEALTKAEQDRITAAERSATSVQDQVQKLLDEEKALAISAAANISLAQAIEEVNIARLREQQAQLMAKGDRDSEVLAIQKEIDARKQLQQAIGRQEARKEAAEAADAAAKEWQKTADSIEATLTDALMRGFEGGKSFGENFADSLVNTFKTYVAREIAKAISNAIISSMVGQNWAGLIGGLTGGGGGGYGGLLTNANNASSLASAYNTFTTGAGSNYGAVAGWATGGMSTANLAGSIYANAATAGMSTGSIAASGAGIDALLATNAAYGTAAGAGAAGAGAASGAAAAGAAGGSSGALSGAASVLGQIPVWGWVAIAAIALWQPLFGRKLKEVGTQINFREGDISTNDYKFEKGGIFRSDKTSILGDTTAANSQLVQEAENVQESAKGMARALGFGTEAIDAFSGTVNVNLKGVKSNDEAAQKYAEALQELQRQMLNAATGANMTEEAFAEWIKGINDSMQQAGISTQGIADILIQGMLGQMDRAQVGEALANMVIGGIYNAIASPFAGQIASTFTAQIIQPIFTAIAAGVPISQAISQQAISNVVRTAQEAASALNAIFADPSFRAAIAGVQQAISGISAAATSVRAPNFRPAVASYNAAAEAAKRAAEEIKRAWQGIADSLLDEIRRIRGEIVGDTQAGYAFNYAQFTTATAQARAGSQEAAERLPELSRALIDLAATQAASLSDLNVIRGQILKSLADTREIIGARYGLTLPAFDVGTNRVEKDMVALIHEGEAIVPKAYNPAAGGVSGDNRVVEQLSILNKRIESLTAYVREIEADTARLDRNVNDVTQGGTAILTEAA